MTSNRDNVIVNHCGRFLAKGFDNYINRNGRSLAIVIDNYINWKFVCGLKSLINKNPRDALQIDFLDNHKDILSKILYLPTGCPEIKYGLLKVIINIFRISYEHFLRSSTLLEDIINYHYEHQQNNSFDTGLLAGLLELADYVIGSGIDLNYVNNRSELGDTTLMFLFKFEPLIYLDNYDLPYKVAQYAISKYKQNIDVDIQNKNGDTVLTYLARYCAANEIVFGLFKKLFKLSNDKQVIYNSRIHYKALISAIDTSYILQIWAKRRDRILNLLCQTYPYFDKDVDLVLNKWLYEPHGQSLCKEESDKEESDKKESDKEESDKKESEKKESEKKESDKDSDKHSNKHNSGYLDGYNIFKRLTPQKKNSPSTQLCLRIELGPLLKDALAKSNEAHVSLFAKYKQKYEQFKTSVYFK